MKLSTFFLILPFFIIKNHFGQCDSTIIQGDFFITNDTTLSGSYYVLGSFHVLDNINVDVKKYSNNSCGLLKVYADKIIIDGTIDASFAGYSGGLGGGKGDLVSSSTGDAGGLTGCSDSGNPGQIEVEAGFGGADGNGSGGGFGGKDGRSGSGPKQECTSSDDAGLVAGASGGSGGGGGSYGGYGEYGGFAGDGVGTYNKSNLGLSSAYAINPGYGKSGGDPGDLYGTNTGLDIDLGSGGGGAGGGGRSYSKGVDGNNGGSGGGMVYLNALSDSLIVTGSIIVNGEDGDWGGYGGDGGTGQSSSSGCCSDPCNDCGEKTFSCGAGGGGGSGGGSGGGIFLTSNRINYITGNLNSNGGDGGNGGVGGYGIGCSYNAPFGCGGNQSISTDFGEDAEKGGGGGGGRIKIFASDCLGNIILPNVDVFGGSGEGSADPGYFHLDNSLPCQAGSPPPPPLSIQETLDKYFSVFPNPAKDLLNVDFGNVNYAFLVNAEITIYDVFGKLICQKNLSSNDFLGVFIDLSEFNNGIYILKLNANKHLIERKFLKIN
ncbi:MAG: hypothetical protein CL846_06450 [Crocinitomicaceae bacterium]|nr:hypothetical protein [Crocinitomicaceae bacterium]|tara:strand:+ start:1821 stop:3458 length:1638 start_codon:yes stop_codon:yes gene_type:complete